MTSLNLDRYAVFGQPIKHSKSPRIHHLFAEQTGESLSYTAIEVAPGHFTEAVTSFFANGGKGLNCTVPLKELAWTFAEHKTERAELARAVNTLALQADGSILGDNTDGCGLVTDLLTNHAIGLEGKRILVLGAGGASRGIILPLLQQQPTSLVIANRTVDKAIALAAEFQHKGSVAACGFMELSGQSYDVILNATSASLSEQLPPLPVGLLLEQGICYDLAYNQTPTPFVRWGKANHAAKSLDGLGMLVEQAAEAFFIWRGLKPQTVEVLALLNAERQWPLFS
jgi:shikimate dehydrogenase